jgi:hypothetical protein
MCPIARSGSAVTAKGHGIERGGSSAYDEPHGAHSWL